MRLNHKQEKSFMVEDVYVVKQSGDHGDRNKILIKVRSLN